MATSTTNTTIANFNTPVAVTKTSATADTANLTEQFEIIPKSSRFIIGVEVGDTNGAVTYKVFKGSSASSAQILNSGTCAQAETSLIQIDTYGVSASGTITLELTPANGKKLVTDHVAKVVVIDTI